MTGISALPQVSRSAHCADAGPLSATGREIGRAVVEAVFFWFDVAQHRPHRQSNQSHGGYDNPFQQIVVQGYFGLLRIGAQLRNFPNNRPDTNTRNHQFKKRRECMLVSLKN
jgi:hypothetical protein